MHELNIALLQLAPCGDDQAANLAKGEAFCRRAKALGADIALFPEMWNIGYTFPCQADAGARDQPEGDIWRAPELWEAGAADRMAVAREAITRWQAQAIGRDDPFVIHFRALARELDMAIALTYLERWDGPPRNSVSLIDRHGAIVLTYAKVHTCDFDLPEAACTPGDDFLVGTLDTAAGAVRIGTMICYDREFPESARVLMLKGAEIILVPNACDMEANRLTQLRARAFENMIGIAMANYAGLWWGHSIAFDGIAFEDGKTRDMLIVEAGEGEGIHLARFDLDRLRAYRTREAFGNAFRKPHRYGLLTALEVEPPFVRVDSSGACYDRTRR